MKAKIITTICSIIAALALFVFLPAEAKTVSGQLLWTCSWLIVLFLCVKGMAKYGEFSTDDEEV